jgi:hypothetical protein
MQLRGRHGDVDHADVGRRVCPEHLGRRLATVLEGHGDSGGAGYDVLVGEDVALGVIDDARALALGHLGAAATAAERIGALAR